MANLCHFKYFIFNRNCNIIYVIVEVVLLKLKWRHKENVGKVKFKSEEIIRMLKLGARFELTPSYTEYLDKDGKTKKVVLNHMSLRLLN